jgi:hypothetical protein
MLTWTVAIFSVAWGLWLSFIFRYPVRWSGFIDRVHLRLGAYGLSAEWMRRAEKGITLKLLVAGTTIVSLACLAILLKHPTALDYFLHPR